VNGEITDDHNQKTWKIIHPSRSSLEERFELAQFEVHANALSFEWNEHALAKTQFSELSQLLRDSVVTVEAGDHRHYLVLRSPPTLSAKPIPLVEAGPQPVGYKHRRLIRAWAHEDLLRKTLWKLRIRRWRIDVFPENGRKTTFSEGNNADLVTRIEKQIVPGRIDLKLAIEKYNIQIDLDFDEGKIMDDFDHWDDISRTEKVLREELDAMSKQEVDPESNRKKEAEIRRDLENVKKERAELGPRIEKYHQVRNNFGSELSLVVGLVVNDKIIIDLAHIGHFATPTP
jgi:hypothetical protein